MIDLHIHTNASDGSHTPGEILARCEALGLDVISLTDHNTADAYLDLEDPKTRNLFHGKILPGIEFGCSFRGTTVEVLGYGVDPQTARTFSKKHYPSTKESIRMGFELSIKTYGERGFLFDRSKTYPTVNELRQEILSHPENRARLTDPRSAKSKLYFLRHEVHNPQSPYHLPSLNHLSPKEICDFIRAEGGRSFIAHPGIYRHEVFESLEELLTESTADGLEVFYPIHTAKQREALLALCRKHCLLFSGGSDYHYKEREQRGNILGNPAMEPFLPMNEAMKWINQLNLL